MPRGHNKADKGVVPKGAKGTASSKKWGARLTWRSPWADDRSCFVAIRDRPVLMDSGWFHDSSSQSAFGYTYLRRVIVFHHESSPEARAGYVSEVTGTPVVDDLGGTIIGGAFSATDIPHGDVVWLEYTRDHAAMY